MTKTEYAQVTAETVDEWIRHLIGKGLLTPDKIEPLKDELLTAIDWHCAPRPD